MQKQFNDLQISNCNSVLLCKIVFYKKEYFYPLRGMKFWNFKFLGKYQQYCKDYFIETELKVSAKKMTVTEVSNMFGIPRRTIKTMCWRRLWILSQLGEGESPQ